MEIAVSDDSLYEVNAESSAINDAILKLLINTSGWLVPLSGYAFAGLC